MDADKPAMFTRHAKMAQVFDLAERALKAEAPAPATVPSHSHWTAKLVGEHDLHNAVIHWSTGDQDNAWMTPAAQATPDQITNWLEKRPAITREQVRAAVESGFARTTLDYPAKRAEAVTYEIMKLLESR